MNIIYKNLKNIVIVLLIGLVVLLRACQPEPVDLTEYIKIGGKKYELLKKEQKTVYIHINDTIKEYVPKYITKLKEIEVPVLPTKQDTLEILKDYYTNYKIEDTLQVSEYGYGYLTDIVSRNKIQSRSLIWDLKIPKVVETITVLEPPKNQMYIGGNIGFDKINFLNQVSAGLLLKTKKDKIYGVNIGVTQSTIDNISSSTEFTPFIGGSMYWKIKLRKD
jgi:hypothetical protein